jgi:hypothetical protein
LFWDAIFLVIDKWCSVAYFLLGNLLETSHIILETSGNWEMCWHFVWHVGVNWSSLWMLKGLVWIVWYIKI